MPCLLAPLPLKWTTNAGEGGRERGREREGRREREKEGRKGERRERR